ANQGFSVENQIQIERARSNRLVTLPPEDPFQLVQSIEQRAGRRVGPAYNRCIEKIGLRRGDTNWFGFNDGRADHIAKVLFQFVKGGVKIRAPIPEIAAERNRDKSPTHPIYPTHPTYPTYPIRT